MAQSSRSEHDDNWCPPLKLPRGWSRGHGKLDEDMVRECRLLYMAGLGLRDIRQTLIEQFNVMVSIPTIADAIAGRDAYKGK